MGIVLIRRRYGVWCIRKCSWDTWGVFLWNRGKLQNFSIINEARREFYSTNEDISRIYEYIKNEGPAYGLHIQESKTKIWWPKMTSQDWKNSIATFFMTKKGNLTQELPSSGQLSAPPNYIRAHFQKVFDESARHPWLPQRNEKSSDRLSFSTLVRVHLSCVAPPAQYPAGSFKNLRFPLGHDFPRGFCCNTWHPTQLPAARKVFLDSSFSTYPSLRSRYNICIVNSRSSIRRVSHWYIGSGK